MGLTTLGEGPLLRVISSLRRVGAPGGEVVGDPPGEERGGHVWPAAGQAPGDLGKVRKITGVKNYVTPFFLYMFSYEQTLLALVRFEVNFGWLVSREELCQIFI